MMIGCYFTIVIVWCHLSITMIRIYFYILIKDCHPLIVVVNSHIFSLMIGCHLYILLGFQLPNISLGCQFSVLIFWCHPSFVTFKLSHYFNREATSKCWIIFHHNTHRLFYFEGLELWKQKNKSIILILAQYMVL